MAEAGRTNRRRRELSSSLLLLERPIVPYVNSRGVPMPESATPTSNVYGTNSGGETLTAPAGPSAVDSGGGPNDLLIGSSGDNIFYIRDGSDRVQVADGLPGVKSIVAYTSYTLPANVQNLSVSGNFSYAVGNALPNLIVGQNGPEQLYGGAGDDVLVGAGNGTSFIVAAGEGSDAIYNFSSSDTIRLIGSNFHAFAEVQEIGRASCRERV